MLGYKLTTEQYNQLQNQFYSDCEFFNCVKDVNEEWYLILSEQDKEEVANTQWNWILSLSESEYIPPQPLPPPISK